MRSHRRVRGAMVALVVLAGGGLVAAQAGKNGPIASGRAELADTQSALRSLRTDRSVRVAQALEILTASTELRDRLEANTQYFRAEIAKVGLDVLPGEHPITPVMLYDAALAGRVASARALAIEPLAVLRTE